MEKQPSAIAEHFTSVDARYLEASVRLGARMLGRTSPNPAVGALLVQDTPNGLMIVASAATAPEGRPHAETQCIERAGALAKGATLYVSLEPCSHYGRTPPCANAIIAAGIARVVIGCVDPDPRVSGKGVSLLRDAGIVVVMAAGNSKSLAERAHQGHCSRILHKRPFVTAKIALSADDAIGVNGQGNVPVSSPETRGLTHALRSRHDAIAVGRGTWDDDQPLLNVRLKGREQDSPVRLILSKNENGISADAEVLDGRDFASTLHNLAGRDVSRLMIEPGARLARCLLENASVDEWIIYRNPRVLGEGALRPFDAPIEALLIGSGAYICTSRSRMGQDIVLRFAKHAQKVHAHTI